MSMSGCGDSAVWALPSFQCLGGSHCRLVCFLIVTFTLLTFIHKALVDIGLDVPVHVNLDSGPLSTLST